MAKRKNEKGLTPPCQYLITYIGLCRSRRWQKFRLALADFELSSVTFSAGMIRFRTRINPATRTISLQWNQTDREAAE